MRVPTTPIVVRVVHPCTYTDTLVRVGWCRADRTL